MYQLTKEELARLGAEITTREIHQQPKLWQETLENYEKAYERVTSFLASVKKNTTSRVRVIFTGAGTSQYKVDVLKVEVPVNMNYVEGFAEGEVVYTREEALCLFKEQSDATNLPFIFLSAGVSAALFQETLRFAKEAGSTFNGVLCGRATWKNGVEPFIKEGEAATREWLQTQGRENMESLNRVVAQTASLWHDKLKICD